jgi:hypothetical protein
LLPFVSFASVAAIVVGLVVLFRAAQTPPAFYTQAVEVDPHQGAAKARALETHVLDLTSEVRHEDRWQLTLSDDELNGWLATTLPQKFPQALPREVEAPRIAIEPDLLQVACRYESGGVTSVLSIGMEPYLIDEPSTLAIRIRHVRAGILPIPVRQFLDDIAERALKGGLHLRWDEVEGDPVAILKLNLDPKHVSNRQITLDTLDIQPGQLTLGGKSLRQ